MRFAYDRITPDQFLAALQEADLTPGAFSRIFGVNIRSVDRWIGGGKDIPVWPAVALAMIIKVKGNRSVARRTAAHLIREDLLRPEMGDYPYRAEGDLPEDMETEAEDAPGVSYVGR